MKKRSHQKLNGRDVELVVSHIKFAKRLARQFYQERIALGIEAEEFEGAAMLGLCDAARRYDETKGIHFQTFSCFRIRGAMFDLLRRGGWVPRKNFADLIERGRERLECGQGEDRATASEESRTGVNLPFAFARNLSDLARLQAIIEQVGIRVHVSPEAESTELEYAGQLSPEEISMLGSTHRFLARLVAQLPEDERKLLELRYFEGLGSDELRKALRGVSKSWISRTHIRALERLRNMIVEEKKRCDLNLACHGS